jgi:outer membrane protein OmpA-like peptidoglycan-associated protein
MVAVFRPNLPVADRRSYRRGQILGLTVAEFFLVLAFLLLLALGLMATRMQGERQIKEIRTSLSTNGVDVTTEQLVERLKEASNAESKVEELQKDLAAAKWREQAQLAEAQRFASLTDAAKGMTKKQYDDFIELVRQVGADASGPDGETDTMTRLLSDRQTIETVRKIAKNWTESNSKIADDLAKEFGADLSRWNAEIDKKQLVIRFNNPDVLFEQGQAVLKSQFEQILSDFCPRFLTMLSRYGNDIAEIRIEGHTSSEWRETTAVREAYFHNMALSQSRTRAALEYCLNLDAVGGVEGWARSTLVAVGMSSSHLIVDSTANAEDRERSRRVEFRIVTDAARRIGEVVQEVRSTTN